MSDNARLAAALPPISKPGPCCSFCGGEREVIEGARVAICEDCGTLIVGMFLVRARDGLSLVRDFPAIFSRASTEYFRDFGQPPTARVRRTTP